MHWPGQSPDLNPTENFRAFVKKTNDFHYERAPTDMTELWERINIEWPKIPYQTIQN